MLSPLGCLYFSLDGNVFCYSSIEQVFYAFSLNLISFIAKILRFGLLIFTPDFLQLVFFLFLLHFIEIISFNSFSVPAILSSTSSSHIPEGI